MFFLEEEKASHGRLPTIIGFSLENGKNEVRPLVAKQIGVVAAIYFILITIRALLFEKRCCQFTGKV